MAERLARENPAYSFVTPDGTTYQGRVVSGGRPSEAGPLGMKRELRSLDAEVLQLERAASEAQAALHHIEEELRASETDARTGHGAARGIGKTGGGGNTCSATRRAATWCASEWN